MADAELWLEIFNAIGYKDMESESGDYFLTDSYGEPDTNFRKEEAHDLIAMYALRWLGDRGWRTLFIESDRIKCGYAPDGGICDLSITGPVAQTLCEAIKRQLEREEK